MADGLETTTKGKLSPAETVRRMAASIFDRLEERFTRLKSCEGTILDDDSWHFVIKGPSIGLKDGSRRVLECEAKFAAGTKEDRIYGSFYGWCDQNGLKLGAPVKKGRDEQDEAA